MEQEAAVARCRSSAAVAIEDVRAHAENRCERHEEGFVSERDRAAVAEETALGMLQYAESTKRVIDRECSEVKKHERDLVENAEAMAWHEESCR